VTAIQAVLVAEPIEQHPAEARPLAPRADPTAERWDLRFGARVEYDDQPLGWVHSLSVTPKTCELTHLVVRRGLFARQVDRVPVDLVDDADQDRVTLRRLPVDRARASAANSDGTDVRLVSPTVTSRTHVMLDDRDEGRLALLLVESATRRVTHVVVRRGMLGSRQLIVPMDRVVELTPSRLVLDLDSNKWDDLPDYRPDDEIVANVERALEGDEIIRRLSAPFLTVTARRGVVTVSGNLATSAHRSLIARAVRSVPGVLALRNLPIGDDELEITVAQALALDPQTRPLIIPIQANLGMLRLFGDMPSAARDLARVVPGVRGVCAFPTTRWS
jgi:hypothetical protein